MAIVYMSEAAKTCQNKNSHKKFFLSLFGQEKFVRVNLTFGIKAKSHHWGGATRGYDLSRKYRTRKKIIFQGQTL
jgi:hypothetical protein